MARGRPRKKVEPENEVFEAEKDLEEPQNEPEQPEKDDLVTPFEAALMLNVPESTVKLWFDHGHLTGKGQYGHIRISRGSLFGARIKKLISGPMG